MQAEDILPSLPQTWQKKNPPVLQGSRLATSLGQAFLQSRCWQGHGIHVPSKPHKARPSVREVGKGERKRERIKNRFPFCFSRCKLKAPPATTAEPKSPPAFWATRRPSSGCIFY